MSSIEPHPHSNFAGSLALLCALVVAPPSPAHAAAGGRMEFQYALLQTGRSMTCATDSRNFGHAFSRLQDEVERTGHEVLWFSIKDRPYVIRDSATVERVHQILEPVTRLGSEQGRVGSMQGELGRRQGELGHLQGEVAQVQAHLADLEARDDPRQRADLDELRQQVMELSSQVRGIAARQRGLGVQQAELGRQQAELGAQQARASRLAFAQLRGLADQAIASGKAEAIGSD